MTAEAVKRALISGSCAVLMVAPAASAREALPALDGLAEGWNVIETGGTCSTGSPYRFYVHPGKADGNLMVFFNGGGACWFGQQCDLRTEPNTHFPFAEMAENDPRVDKSGVFDLDNPENPFSDDNIVFVPYCTGDVHVGAGARSYSYTGADGNAVEVLTHHTGNANSMTVLEWVYDNFSSPGRVLVGGSSAGAIGASFYSGQIADHYTELPVVLIADAAGGYNSPLLPVTFNSWNTAAILPDWPEYAGKTNDTLTFEDFYIASALHADNLTIAQYNTMNDEVQVNFTLLLGDPPGSFSIGERILNHYNEIEDAVGVFHNFTAGGTVHTIMRSPEFYSYSVEGARFVDWLARLAAGEPVGDVSCVDEPAGCAAPPQ